MSDRQRELSASGQVRELEIPVSHTPAHLDGGRRLRTNLVAGQLGREGDWLTVRPELPKESAISERSSQRSTGECRSL